MPMPTVPPSPLPCPAPPRAHIRTSRICVIALLLLVALLAAEYVLLTARQRAWAVARANERVEAKIETARAHLTAQHWGEAIRHLEDALNVDGATHGAEARPVLELARRGQADALLEAALLAIARRDAADAQRLLRAYALHPQATDPERARLLLADLQRAADGEAAARVLARLSDDALAFFAKQGQLTEDDGFHTEGAREIFKDTLHRRLPIELQRRQARREIERLAAVRRATEHERRIARLRAAPEYRSATAFAAHTLAHHREQQQLAHRQEMDLSQLLQQLGVKDPQEQATIRADLTGGDGNAAIRESIERKKAEFKRAYRASPAFQAGDGEWFDRIVDETLDPLLKMLPSS